MANSQQVAVLAAYKPFLHILTIYDSKNFQNLDRHIIFSNRCQAIAVSVLIIAFSIGLYSVGLYCVVLNFDVGEVALQLALFINSLQLMITYVALRINNDDVDNVIAEISNIVTQRK